MLQELGFKVGEKILSRSMIGNLLAVGFLYVMARDDMLRKNLCQHRGNQLLAGYMSGQPWDHN